MNSWKGFENLLGNRGGSLADIEYIALSGGTLKYGGSPYANSIAIMPTLHISTFSS